MNREERAEQRERAEAELDRRVVNDKCPFCETNQWGTWGRSAAIPVYEPGGGVVAESGFAALFRFCRTCGFVRFHLAEVLTEAPPVS